MDFPEKDWLPQHLLPKLESLLPEREDIMISDDMEEVDLSDYNYDSQRRSYSREAYEEDEEGPRSHGVQCQTQ